MGDEASGGEAKEERRRGRPTNVEKLERARSGSEGNIAELLAGKRKALALEGKRGGKGEQEGDPFKRSKVMERSPEKAREEADGMTRVMEKWEGMMTREAEKWEKRVEEMSKGWERRVEQMAEGWGRRMEEVVKEAREEREEMLRRWEGERNEMRSRLEELEKRVEALQVGGKEGEVVAVREGRREEKEKEENAVRRIRELELRMDREEREKRRRNVIVKGVRMGEGVDWGKEIDRIWGKMEVEGGIMGKTAIGGVNREGRGMVLVELKGRMEKVEVMKAKGKLRGDREWVEDDLTRMEREVKWRIEREAEKERRQGEVVRVGYMKMWVDSKCKIWDEVTGGWRQAAGDQRKAEGEARG